MPEDTVSYGAQDVREPVYELLYDDGDHESAMARHGDLEYASDESDTRIVVERMPTAEDLAAWRAARDEEIAQEQADAADEDAAEQADADAADTAEFGELAGAAEDAPEDESAAAAVEPAVEEE